MSTYIGLYPYIIAINIFISIYYCYYLIYLYLYIIAINIFISLYYCYYLIPFLQLLCLREQFLVGSNCNIVTIEN